MVLLTVPEAAAFLKVKTSSIYKYLCQRKIPYIKVVGHVRFDLNQLEHWVATQAVRAQLPRKSNPLYEELAGEK